MILFVVIICNWKFPIPISWEISTILKHPNRRLQCYHLRSYEIKSKLGCKTLSFQSDPLML
jgi:hypothetical protein